MEDKNINLDYSQDTEESLYEGISEEELERLKSHRQERYTNGRDYYAPNKKTVSKKTVIVVLVLVFLYYIAIFALNLAGVIGKLLMFGLTAGGVVALLIVYRLLKKKS